MPNHIIFREERFTIALIIFYYQSAVFFRASLSTGSFSAASLRLLMMHSVLLSTGASMVLLSRSAWVWGMIYSFAFSIRENRSMLTKRIARFITENLHEGTKISKESSNL